LHDCADRIALGMPPLRMRQGSILRCAAEAVLPLRKLRHRGGTLVTSSLIGVALTEPIGCDRIDNGS